MTLKYLKLEILLDDWIYLIKYLVQLNSLPHAERWVWYFRKFRIKHVCDSVNIF